MSDANEASRKPTLRSRLKACGAGVLGTVAATSLLHLLCPRWVVVDTLLPLEGGLFVGIVLALWVARRAEPRAAELFRWACVAFTLCALLVAAFVLPGGPKMISGRYKDISEGVLAALGLLVWITAYFKERRVAIQNPLYTALLVGLALAAFTFEEGRYLRKSLEGDRVQTWNVYHYYMGSKYFAENGYRNLYVAHLAADDEWRRTRPAEMNGKLDYANVVRARSMVTYKLTPRKELVDGFDRSAFTDDRWESFGRDIRAFHPLFPRKTWPRVLRDLGYNPAPPWTLVGTTLSNLIGVDTRAFWLIKNSDLPLYAVALICMLWAFGPRLTAVASLWLLTIPVNNNFFSGAFLRYDWLSLSLVAFALYKRRCYRASGIALAWPAMTRVFPGMLALPIVFRLVARLPGGGWANVRRRHLHFGVSFCSACALLFVASHFTGRGITTWPDWVDDIKIHSRLHPATSNKRFGVPRLALHEPRADKFWASSPERGQEELAGANMGRRRVMQVLGMALLLVTLRRRRDLDSMIMMLFAVFLLSTTSRYYASIWSLLFFLDLRKRDGPISWAPALAGGMLLLAVPLFFSPGPSNINGQYYLLNYEILLLFTALCIGFLAQDRRKKKLRPNGERSSGYASGVGSGVGVPSSESLSTSSEIS